MDDQSRKTMRNFYCRDYLWELYEAMAGDFDCSIDFLINEAMRHYARSKNYSPPIPAPEPPMSNNNVSRMPNPRANQAMGGPRPIQQQQQQSPAVYNSGRVAPIQPTPGNNRPQAHPNGAGMAPSSSPYQQQQQAPMAAEQAPPAMHPQNNMGPRSLRQPVPPNMRPANMPNSGRPPIVGRASSPTMAASGPPMQQPNYDQQPRYEQVAPPAPVNRPIPTGGHARPAMAPTRPTLTLIFQGQRRPVDKDEFIIGRGSKTSDLAIKDGNVSRKHAAVICRNGTYFIQDCGSTNGIDYNGMRIDNKKIEEGDIFFICDYELRFTYR